MASAGGSHGHTVEALAISMLSHGGTLSPEAYILQWKPVTGIRLGVCRYTAGEASYREA